MNQLDAKFGEYGGMYVPELLIPALDQLEQAFLEAKDDPAFNAEFMSLLKDYAGRPTSMTLTRNLVSNPKVKLYLKREDLLHGGAHKTNQVLGQALLTKRMGKTEVIAETGAGQHGAAVATVAAMFGFDCAVYMGEEDIERQSINVFKMRLMGTEVVPVSSGTKTLKDAINESFRDWVTNVHDTYLCVGSVVSAHPYPVMVRDFQSVIGKEARAQILKNEGRLHDYLLACVGGGSNSMGLFYPFFEDEDVKFVGVEAAGFGLQTMKHGASLTAGSVGVLHGSKCHILQDENGQIMPTHSISAGLDYPGVGPEHSFYKDSDRAEYVAITDDEALDAFRMLSEEEGIIPALESAHAVAYAIKLAPTLDKSSIIIICLSGRGDKDVQSVIKMIE